jgi:hypothetical protein
VDETETTTTTQKMKTILKFVSAAALACGILVASSFGGYYTYTTNGGVPDQAQNDWTGISIPSTCGVYSEIYVPGNPPDFTAYVWVLGPGGGVHSLSSTYGPWVAHSTQQPSGTYEVHHIVKGANSYADTVITW